MARVRAAVAAAIAGAAAIGSASACGDRDDGAAGREEAAETEARGPEGTGRRPGAPLALGEGVESLLDLANRLPPGSTLERARERLPGLGPPGPEGGLESAAGASLSEARLPVEVLGRRGHAELNFRLDTLYSLYLSLDPVPCARAESLYAALRGGLAARLGEALEEEEREPGYRSRTAFWPAAAEGLPASPGPAGAGRDTTARAPGTSFVATLGIQGETCRLGWGYQASR